MADDENQMADDNEVAPDEEATPDAEVAAEAAAPAEDEAAPEVEAPADGEAEAPLGAPLGEDTASAPEAAIAPAADAPESAEESAPGAAGDGEPISQDDIDQLFQEQGAEPASAPAAASHPAGGGATEIDPSAASLLGNSASMLAAFGAQARETLTLGIESAMGQTATIAGISISASEYSVIEEEFGATPHLGFELRVSLSETESHLVGVLLPLPDAGALFSIETTPDQMTDETHAQAQVDAAAATMRELLDLVSLTLFTEALSAAEVTLSDQRVDQIEFTMGIVADVAQGSPPLRLDVVLALPEGIPVTITLVVPSSLAARLAEMIAASEPADEFLEPTPIDVGRVAAQATAAAAAVGGAGGGRPPMEPARPAATIGASPDIDVHPVRFPPLPELEAPATAHRGLELIMDVQMRVAVELGRSTMTVEDVLSLGPGSVVELNKLAGEAVDILVNERLIARGEVVVVDENFGVRVTEIVSPRRRANAMSS